MPFSDSWYGGTAGYIATPGSCRVYRRRESLDALGSSKGPLKGLGCWRRRRDCSCSLVSNSPCEVRYGCEPPRIDYSHFGKACYASKCYPRFPWGKRESEEADPVYPLSTNVTDGQPQYKLGRGGKTKSTGGKSAREGRKREKLRIENDSWQPKGMLRTTSKNE